MKFHKMMKHWYNLKLLALCIALAVLDGCSSWQNTGYLYRTSSAANNHIMLVREKPQTFGFKRLIALSRHYPGLALFLERESLPRYLAETRKSGNHYLILYYSDQRRAFACRSDKGSSHQVEFSGPYPITESELKTLRRLEIAAFPISQR